MKKLNTITKSILVLSTVFVTNFSFASTYTTINDGKWDDKTTVWSLDGETPCKCNPSSISNGNDIIVNNDITTSYNITINNRSHLEVSKLGKLTGSYSAFVDDAVVNIDGTVELVSYVQDSSSSFHLDNRGVLILSHTCSILNGQFRISEGEMNLTSGNLIVGLRAELNLSKQSALFIDFGAIINAGTFLNDSFHNYSDILEESAILANQR